MRTSCLNGVGQEGQGTSSGGALDGELVEEDRDTDPAPSDYTEPAGYVAPDDGFDLTGVEQF
jgi:hypothetical protein